MAMYERLKPSLWVLYQDAGNVYYPVNGYQDTPG